MSRYIDADAIIERMKKDPLFPLVERYGVTGVIEAEPTADVRENVHAEWLPYEFGTKRWHKCSACGIADEYINEKGLEARREFCPHCGAQMDGKGRK